MYSCFVWEIISPNQTPIPHAKSDKCNLQTKQMWLLLYTRQRPEKIHQSSNQITTNDNHPARFFLVNLFAIMEKIINLVFFLLLLTFRTCHVTMNRFYHVFSISLHFSTENHTKVTFSQNYHHANMSYKVYYIARQHSILYFLVFLAF